MDHDDRRLLARFAGARPPAPAWFDAAMAIQPEAGQVEVEGAGISCLAWGSRGAPGLLLVHGGWAHAGWWAHIAPLLATTHRVAALSLSGMGASDWRPRYSIRQYAREMHAVARQCGLFDAGLPAVAGHSFGCAPTIAALAADDIWMGQAILIDGSITMKPSDLPPSAGRRNLPFATVEAALARYRLMPSQPCENAFVADMIARGSLRQMEGGFAWSFDPTLYERCAMIDSRATVQAANRPVTFLRGERSGVVSPETYAGLKADLPPGSRFVEIPDAGHHIMIDQPLALVAALRAVLAG